MAFPVLQSEDGRVQRVVTSEDELETLKAQGYTRVGGTRRSPEKADEKTDEK